MAWPQATDYTAAVQNPAACFTDPALAVAVPEMNLLLGTPLSYCGNFAIVFKVASPTGEAWAVKCFIREVTDHQQRYSLISQHLEQNRKRFAVEFGYQPEGILVGGTAYPLVKMRWVEGHPLNEFLRDHAGNGSLVEQLAGLWLRLAGEMREARMAHGDLQHGNALLAPGKNAGSMVLRLVDYDGMWVPPLEGQPPGERGHANYQHPQRLRDGGYSAEIDRFAHLSIYAGLRCLAAGGKALWDKHDNGENLLFRAADFAAPQKSKLWPDLLELPDADALLLAGHLACASQGPLDAVPLLADLVSTSGAVAPLRVAHRDQLADLFPGVKSFRKMNLPPPLLPSVPAPPPVPAMYAVVQDVPPLPAPMEAVPVLEEVPSPLPSRRRKRSTTPPAALVLTSMLGVLALLAVPLWFFWPVGDKEPAYRYEGEPQSATVRAGKTAQVALRFAWKGEEPPALSLRLEAPARLNARVLSQKMDDHGITYRIQAAPPRQADKGRSEVVAVLASEGKEIARATAHFDIEPYRVRLGDLEPVILRAGSSAELAGVVFGDHPLPSLAPGLSNLPDKVAQQSFSLRPDGKMSLVLSAKPRAEESQRTVTLLLRDGPREAVRGSFLLTVVPASSRPPMAVVAADPMSRKLELSGPVTLVLGKTNKVTAALTLKRTNLPGKVTIRPDLLPAGVWARPASTEGDMAEIELSVFPLAETLPWRPRVRMVALQGTERLATYDLVLEVLAPKGAPTVVPVPKDQKPLPVRRVQFSTADGLSLEGRLWPVRRPKEANTVLLLPDARRGGGMSGTMIQVALTLQKEGYSVFAFDFRGQGDNRLRDAGIPNAFYGSCPANALLQKNLAKGRRTAASRAKPPLEKLPAWYRPWLVQDVIAARCFLDAMHDNAEVNSQNLIVVAIGEGGLIAPLWLSTETFRTNGFPNATPASQDVRALLLVGVPPFAAPWSSKNTHLAVLAKSEALPPVQAIADSAGNGAGPPLAKLMRPKGVAANTTTTAKGKQPAYGHDLLALDGMAKLVVETVGKMPKGAWRPWADRNFARSSYRWNTARSPMAKWFNSVKPELFPLNVLGFRGLSR